MNKLFVLAAITVAAVGLGVESKKAAVKAVKPAAQPAVTAQAQPAAPATSAPAEADRTTSATTSTAAVAAPSAAKLLGEVEVRPSWTVTPDEFHTENYAMLGYQFDKTKSLSYYQAFNTNLYDPGTSAKGLGLYAFDGFLRGKVNKIYESGGTSLNYEARAYAPTYSAKRDAGMITIIRNYAKLVMDFNKTFSLAVYEIPIVHVYSRSANLGKANPLFENRVYLIGTINFTDKLSLDLPVMFHQSKARGASGTANDGKWTFHVWTYPELTYSVSGNTAVGVAYYNDASLFAPDLSTSTFSDGFKSGVAQVFVRATL